MFNHYHYSSFYRKFDCLLTAQYTFFNINSTELKPSNYLTKLFSKVQLRNYLNGIFFFNCVNEKNKIKGISLLKYLSTKIKTLIDFSSTTNYTHVDISTTKQRRKKNFVFDIFSKKFSFESINRIISIAVWSLKEMELWVKVNVFHVSYFTKIFSSLISTRLYMYFKVKYFKRYPI